MVAVTAAAATAVTAASAVVAAVAAAAMAVVAVAVVEAAATTSPGRANWSPWKPSRSQSGVHSYVHLPLSWRVCSTLSSPLLPLITLNPYKLAPSLALVSPTFSLRLSFPPFFSPALFSFPSPDSSCSFVRNSSPVSPSLLPRLFRPFYLFLMHFYCFVCARSCCISTLPFIPSRSGDPVTCESKNKASVSI